MNEEQGALMKAWNQGRDELAAANAGQMAMDAPPIEMPQTPSYEAMLNQAASQAESRGLEAPDQGMSR